MTNDPLEGMEVPRRIAALPRNDAGYPIPWFVDYVDGKPDFRLMNGKHLVAAVKHKLCWICGETMGSYKAFVIGPMCAVNRVSAEPPSHADCAKFAAKACPFLANPKQKRRETNLPAGQTDVAGIMIKRNPGVALVWITREYKTFNDGQGGVLFRIGDPEETLWFAHGREATREEVMVSIERGLPLLREMAEKDGDEAIAQFEKQAHEALEFLPA
jgi:hypothetical protein